MSNDPSGGAAQSRYLRFKEIMSTAAGTSRANYDGHPAFWNEPLPELRCFTLYGVRMILPPPPAAGSDPAPDCGTPSLSLGATSGLVRGLRGQFPFDGTQFPRMPWGAGASFVAEPDIRLIEQWIDDGCPETDDAVATPDGAYDAQAQRGRSNGTLPHPAHTGPVNDIFAAGQSVKQRKSITTMSDEEWCRLRKAFAWMKSFNKYFLDERSFDYWARIHASQCQHNWEEFLTWHRVYLYEFELKLQDSGDPSVTLPYWDWTDQSPQDVIVSLKDAAAQPPTDPKVPYASTARDNGVIPDAFHCWITADGLARLKAGGVVKPDVIARLSTIVYDETTKKPTYNSGSRLFAAAGIEYKADRASNAAIARELETINPLFHWNRWPGGNADMVFQAYPTPGDVEAALELTTFPAFGSGPDADHFFGALENIHNLIHNFTGGVNPNGAYDASNPDNREDPSNPDLPSEPPFGDMTNGGATAYDPIFWFHHANVDRLWALWQQRHPGAGPDNPTATLSPWTLTVADTTTTQNLGYEYVALAHVFPANPDEPVERFRSAPVAVHPDVLDGNRRVEIRVHTMQHVTRGGFHVRAFLNEPDATVATPTQGNEHYVGQMNVMTGLCIGGPGHCAVPKRSTNRFDKRKRHHKTPSNFRFDATAAVRALAAKDVTDFHVTLVVLNVDGTPAGDALHIDGVSLNFID
jgi:tyrosinase